MMEKIKNQRIVFALPEETTMVKAIFEILKNNGLEESRREAVNKSVKGQDSKLMIIRDSTLALVEKKIPEKKLAEFLAKHLETSQEIAEKIVKDINEKLIPFAKIIDLDQQKKEEEAKRQEQELKEQAIDKEEETKKAFEKAKEELLRKVGAGIHVSEPEKPKENPVAKVPTTNVEENAKQIQQIKKDLTPPKAPNPEPKPPINEPAAPTRSFEKAKEKLAENKFADEKKGPDSYRESIE